jgi:hypothetical protein
VLINNSCSHKTTYSKWGIIKHGVLQVSILGPFFFLIYINYLLTVTADPSKTVLFAEDTGIIITNPILSKFIEDINNIIYNRNDWFRSNSLLLKLDKTYFLRFRPQNSYKII